MMMIMMIIIIASTFLYRVREGFYYKKTNLRSPFYNCMIQRMNWVFFFRLRSLQIAAVIFLQNRWDFATQYFFFQMIYSIDISVVRVYLGVNVSITRQRFDIYIYIYIPLHIHRYKKVSESKPKKHKKEPISKLSLWMKIHITNK